MDSKRINRLVIKLLLLAAGLFLLWQLQFVFIVVLIAFMLTVILLPFVRVLHKARIPAVFAVFLPVLALLGLVALLGFYVAPAVREQFAQFQTVASSRQYDAILVQPIFGPQLIPLVRQAIRNGIKVVNVDQILGTNPGTARPPVAGMSGNVVFIQTAIGRKQGQLVVRACRANNLNPCNVGYLYSVKVSSLDTAIRKGFDAVIKSVPSIRVVAEGETFYQHAVALKAAITEAGLKRALASRDLIGQAKGILMARHGVDDDTAFELLRHGSMRLNRKLRELAQDVVDDTIRPEHLPPHR
jgi:AmiR/NasT family two-component response regulator